MNKTILQGKWRQARGSFKTRWGEMTDDDRQMLDGKIDQMVGLLQERYGYTQERAAQAVKHYLGGYGRQARRSAATPAQTVRLAVAMVVMVALFTTVGFVMARLFTMRSTATERQLAGREPYISPEVQFD
jgi:uncharacterized protein YjbJ (UPF0337 family)